jgi:hypothetical protein
LWRRLGVQVDSSSITVGVAAAAVTTPPPRGTGILGATSGGSGALVILATPNPRGSAACRKALDCSRRQLARRTMNVDSRIFIMVVIDRLERWERSVVVVAAARDGSEIFGVITRAVPY